MPQYFSFNQTQLNPSHVPENATQPNPWMDPTHVHLWTCHSAGSLGWPFPMVKILHSFISPQKW